MLNWPGPVPLVPISLMNRPFLSYFTTREFVYPSATKILPAASQATSVGLPNRYGVAGGGGVFPAAESLAGLRRIPRVCPWSWPRARPE